jgi:hypothetical protein
MPSIEPFNHPPVPDNSDAADRATSQHDHTERIVELQTPTSSSDLSRTMTAMVPDMLISSRVSAPHHPKRPQTVHRVVEPMENACLLRTRRRRIVCRRLFDPVNPNVPAIRFTDQRRQRAARA